MMYAYHIHIIFILYIFLHIIYLYYIHVISILLIVMFVMICFIIYNLCIQTFPSSYFSQLGLQAATTVHYFIFLFRLAARCVDQFGMEALMDLPTPLGKTCLSTFGSEWFTVSISISISFCISIYIYIYILFSFISI